MNDFVRDRRGSAVRGFAMAAVALSIASMAGAHALNWLSRSDHVALVAYRAQAPAQASRVAADAGIDAMPTGSIPSSALMIRIR